MLAFPVNLPLNIKLASFLKALKESVLSKNVLSSITILPSQSCLGCHYGKQFGSSLSYREIKHLFVLYL
jgi:hypothetical protein